MKIEKIELEGPREGEVLMRFAAPAFTIPEQISALRSDHGAGS
jgi:hypothetical protein